MALTRRLAAEKAFLMAVPSGSEEDGVGIADIEEMIDHAIQKLCNEVVSSEDFYRLQTVFSVSVSAGVGSISESCIAETIPESRGGEVLFSVTGASIQPIQPISWVSTLTELRRPKRGRSDIACYTIRGATPGSQIIVADARGNALSGTATIRACTYITFETLPTQLEDEFLFILSDMVKARLSGRMLSGKSSENNSEV